MRNSRAMFRLLQADGNISINKNLIHALGLTESILYCELLSRHSYFEDREKLQEDGSFFNTIYDLQLGTGVGEKSQRTAIKNLEKLGLLKCKVKGVPARRYFYINFDIDIEEFIVKGEEKIKEIKEMIASKQEKSTVQPKGETSSAEKLNKKLQKEKLVQPKGGSNNTNLNNTNYEEEEAIKAYQKTKANKVTKIEKEKLLELQYPKDLILVAINYMAEHASKPNIAYLKATLSDWSNKGLDTIDKVNEAISAWEVIKAQAKENKQKNIKRISESKSKTTGTFNNYPQREYDFEDLERKLLGWE